MGQSVIQATAVAGGGAAACVDVGAGPGDDDAEVLTTRRRSPPFPRPRLVAAPRALPSSFSPCSICHEELRRGRVVRIDCGHRFHDRCLCDWVSQPEGNARCPVCRAPPTIETLLSAMDVVWAERRLREHLLHPLRTCASAGCRREEVICNDGFCAAHGDLAESIRERSRDPCMWKAVVFLLSVVSTPAAEASRTDPDVEDLFRQTVSVVSRLAESLADAPAPRGSELLVERFRSALDLWHEHGDFDTMMLSLDLGLCRPTLLR